MNSLDDNNMDAPKKRVVKLDQSPLRLLVITFAAVVAGEGVIMLFLFLFPVSHTLEIALDPLLLGFLLSPVFYYFMFRPMNLREERLRDSEHKYMTIFEESPDGVLIVDPKTAHAVAFNDTACRQLGYSREEFKALSTPDYEAVEVSEQTQAHIKKILREGYDLFETKHRTKAGELRDVYVKAKALELSGKSFIYAIFNDITEKKAAEKELALKADLLNAATDSIMLMDFNGRIIYANNAAFTSHGYTSEEFLGLKIRDLDTPESAALIEVRINALKETGFAAFEVDHFRKDGSTFPLEVTAKVVERSGERFILSVMRDITDRRRKDKEIQERIDELERFQKITINRELRMKELSDKLKAIEAELKDLKGQ